MSEERGFEVVDKRGARAEEPQAPAADETAAAEVEPGDEGGEEMPNFSGFNPLAGITTSGILQMTWGLLSERAWIDMGMVADPGTGEVKKQISEAKLAIDVLGDLARHLEPLASADERREIQTVLTNLRLNFVRQRDSA